MQRAASAYAKAAQATLSPRHLEASILTRAAARLQGVQDNWAATAATLPDALTYNRKLWTVLAAAATNPNHPLPDAIRVSIVSLANFIFNHTLSLLADPKPERVSVLVTINREVAAGLRAQGSAPA